MRSSAQASKTEVENAYSQWALEARKDRPPESMDEYFRTWASFFDHYAPKVKEWRRRNAGYHQGISSLIRFHIPETLRVLEIGSSTGDLLAETHPRRGVGIDISGEMVRIARENYPNLEFHQ